MKTEQFRILYFEDNQLKDNGSRLGTLEMLRADYPNEWLVIPAADLPADFSVDTYTIESGSLAHASAEQIAEREAAATVAKHESIRAQREERYSREEISSMYWDWVESGNEADKVMWIAAKDAVRKEFPYPEQEGGN